ncbi:MAG: hypothetical protein A2293_10515 [Elusimicrobia bacterium RIFOXYB2_FULL_49_7]|nr:MAG: hypothetical protein A2293_10515 [Elusimicrobia bacterium RIFOXYB2_FULL_49_7]
MVQRPEYPFIESWIYEGAKVIDLGCGNGSLLRLLQERKRIKEYGIELSESGVTICKDHGLHVRQGRIDIPLNDIPDHAYDFSICNVTLQMVTNPEITLTEMKRISKYQILSFPNFAFLSQRLELLFLGRMPQRLLYGYTWYSTGHIHQLSIKDFRRDTAALGLSVKESVFLVGKHRMPAAFMPNLLATEAIMLLEKNSHD